MAYAEVGPVERMLAGVSYRAPIDKTVDSLSGSPFERVIIDGEPYLVKYVGWRVDRLARALGDRDCFVRQLWTQGALAALPAEIDHTIVNVADDRAGDRVALLLCDVGPWLVPAGSSTLPIAQHWRFLEHLAIMHAAFWGFEDRIGLLPPGHRYTALTPATGEREAAAGHDDPIPRALAGGWLGGAPAGGAGGARVRGHAGRRPDPAGGRARHDAGHVRSRRLEGGQSGQPPGRADDQLGPALLGAFLQLGWSKTHDPVELGWWVRTVTPVAPRLLGT